MFLHNKTPVRRPNLNEILTLLIGKDVDLHSVCFDTFGEASVG